MRSPWDLQEVDDQRDHGVAMLVAERRQRGLVAVDHHHARARAQHGLCTRQPDARRGPGHGSNLAFQFVSHGVTILLMVGSIAMQDELAMRIAGFAGKAKALLRRARQLSTNPIEW